MNREQKITLCIEEGCTLAETPISTALSTKLESIPSRFPTGKQFVGWGVVMAIAASLLLLITINGYFWKDSSLQENPIMEGYFSYTKSGL